MGSKISKFWFISTCEVLVKWVIALITLHSAHRKKHLHALMTHPCHNQLVARRLLHLSLQLVQYYLQPISKKNKMVLLLTLSMYLPDTSQPLYLVALGIDVPTVNGKNISCCWRFMPEPFVMSIRNVSDINLSFHRPQRRENALVGCCNRVRT